MPVTMRFRSNFAVRPLVRRVNNDMARPLSRAAGAIRLTARRSIKRRGKRGRSARPGEAPRTYQGQIKRSILYSVDKRNLSAVIGPSFHMIGRVGQTHEFGGKERRRKSGFNLTVGGYGPIGYSQESAASSEGPGRFGTRSKLIIVQLKTKVQVRRAKRISADYDAGRARKKLATYPARPFMDPALKKNLDKLPKRWRGSVSN